MIPPCSSLYSSAARLLSLYWYKRIYPIYRYVRNEKERERDGRNDRWYWIPLYISNGCVRQRVIYSAAAAAATQLSRHDHHQMMAVLFFLSFFSVVVETPSYIRLRPSWTAPDSRGQCAWKLANREEKRGGLLYLVLWARCSSVVYNIPILLILYILYVSIFRHRRETQHNRWDVQCRGNQLRTKRSRLFYSRSVFFLFFFPVDY